MRARKDVSGNDAHGMNDMVRNIIIYFLFMLRACRHVIINNAVKEQEPK